ncbi:MAG: DPP IV N-terminal domain-containing protein [Phycisphaerae bacterium]|nr:DPP IV N-terminal domain-containing protein [Phycisphaerae bacterium]
MKQSPKALAGLLLLTFAASVVLAQGTLEDYKRAVRVRSENHKLVFKTQVRPNWIGETDSFWYRNGLRDGRKQFMLVDPEEGRRKRAFNHKRLAEALAKAAEKEYSAGKLPFDSIRFSDDLKEIRFDVGEKEWKCELKSYKCTEEGPAPKQDRDDRSSRRRRGSGRPRTTLRSPDGKWEAFRRDYNLWVRSTETKEEFELSDDGEQFYDYASSLPGPREIPIIQQGIHTQINPRITGSWSPDSKRIVACRIDQRKSGWFHLVKPVPANGVRPRLHSYVYPLAGEPNVPHAELYLFDVEKKTHIKLDAPAHPMLYFSEIPHVRWSKDSKAFTFRYRQRGYQLVRLYETEGETGKVRTLIEERSDTYVDPTMSHVRYLDETNEIVWSSERDGWCHLHLYDANSAALKNQITKGPWVVRSIVRVDEENRSVFFTAGGREKGRDPYLQHVYRVNLDGSGLTLLTPGNGEHSVKFSPSGKYIVDTYSRVDTAPVTELRRASDGGLVCELEKADIRKLLKSGWKRPEPFGIKARDGKTDVFGVLFRPSNLDPSKKYPVVENIYTGPHGFHTPKSFRVLHRSQDVAELGFVTVIIDGLGTGKRSRAFHNYSYKNLGDGGLEEHIAAIKYLAGKYPYIDATRVGVYGGSAGGYDAAHALLTDGEFYKVAVSSSGNHDHRMDKAWWVELWMGYPAGDHYIEQSNVTLAHKLEGKLLLLHGDMDENVHPASTLQFVDALIKANKDFDMFIAPNAGHGVGGDYFTRKRWDYFVKHLLEKDPPKGFNIKEYRK